MRTRIRPTFGARYRKIGTQHDRTSDLSATKRGELGANVADRIVDSGVLELRWSIKPSMRSSPNADRARVEAHAATEALVTGDSLGALHGLPFGVKDLNDTEGVVTTYGSPLYRDHVPTKDELLVAKLRRAGGILLGKTATPEFGAGGNTTVNEVHGYTRNAFDPDRACGGSSGGSGVALACGMMPLCRIG